MSVGGLKPAQVIYCYPHAILSRPAYASDVDHQRTTLSRTNGTATAWNGYSMACFDGAGATIQVRSIDGRGGGLFASRNGA